MPFQPLDLLAEDQGKRAERSSIGNDFTPVVGQDGCHFPPNIFHDTILNLTKNPNLTSSHLFRADILYDSQGDSHSNTSFAGNDEVRGVEDARSVAVFGGFEVTRTLVRKLIPRNPQLDKPLEQTCTFLKSGRINGCEKHLVVCTPHVDSQEAIPWYHPSVKALAYLYVWTAAENTDNESQKMTDSTREGTGSLTVLYELFQASSEPVPNRLQRIALNLVSTIYKHGEGNFTGYSKQRHHDLLLPQAQVQDTYSMFKRKYAKRLCDDWVELTEPSKHVFEDLGIAAYLIELWRGMYQTPAGRSDSLLKPGAESTDALPEFPGFVDIGCGNGVLTEILLCEGFPGWGFDARRRKTWSVLSPYTQSRLRELILIPQPLLDENPVPLPGPGAIPDPPEELLSTARKRFSIAMSAVSSLLYDKEKSASNHSGSANNIADLGDSRWHNGLFPPGTFIVSNHADELTAWTPLLASLSQSAFLAIPCCSHNLAGTRFRAPSTFTGFTADASAPQYFAREKMAAAKKKHIPIQVPTFDETDEPEMPTSLTGGRSVASGPAETGDLKAMSQANRSKQPSAYQSLCDWVASLAYEVGYEVEKELLRIPSTRNVAIVGRKWSDGSWTSAEALAGRNGMTGGTKIDTERWDTVMDILRRENPDGKTWIARATQLMSGKDVGQTVHR